MSHLNQWLMSVIRQREYEWLASKNGVIDSSMFEAYAKVIPLIFGTERTRSWWNNCGSVFFDPDFQSLVSELLDKSPLSEFWDSLDNWSSPVRLELV